MANIAGNLQQFLQGATKPQNSLLAQGGQTLAQILGSQGATDPRLFNMQSAGISRNTQGLQQALQGSLARSGMQGSGVGLGMQTALGQAGASQQAGLRAQEAQIQEARKRGDLQLLMDMILGPAQQKIAMDRGFSLQQQMMGQQNKGATIGALGALGGGIFGGPIGGALGGQLGKLLGGE